MLVVVAVLMIKGRAETSLDNLSIAAYSLNILKEKKMNVHTI